ncbi:MAG: metallophosphoesterase [Treponema sp.]|jgi:alkaline phosphatase|nr:metallophosphoesterase [Treponema sp.]
MKLVRFGLLADPHCGLAETHINRYYSHSFDKMRQAVTVFKENNLDFIAELGDLKDQGCPPQKNQTLSFLDAAEEILQTFQGPVYHILGNHDMDSISKRDFLKHAGNPGGSGNKSFYAFLVKGIRFVVLDANFNADGSPYDSGNGDWRTAIIPKEEIQWLKQELFGPYPVIILTHQLLDFFSGLSQDYYVKNSPKIVELLEMSGQVLAVFQGHHHEGHYSFRRGIHYVTLKGMIEGSFPENNSFAAVEVDPSLTITLKGFGNCESSVLKREQ